MYEPPVVEGGVMPVTSVPAANTAAGHRYAVPTPAPTHMTAPTTAYVSATPTATHVPATTMTATTVRGDSK